MEKIFSKERIEKIKDNIEDTEREITNIQLTIQGLRELNEGYPNPRFEDKIKINSLIDNLENEISFLEDIKINDEEILKTL